MKENKSFRKEWCAISLLKCKICIETEYESQHLDTAMIGIKLREGVAISILGLTVGIKWTYGQ